MRSVSNASLRASGCTSRKPSCNDCQSSRGAPAASVNARPFAPSRPFTATLGAAPGGIAKVMSSLAETLPFVTFTGSDAGR